jgi:phosphoglycerate dehydrogenase-like enzyme
MTPHPRPTLLLSARFAGEYAGELAAVVPLARIIRHTPEGRYDGDPEDATVAFLSSDMWRTPMGREVPRLLPALPRLEWVHSSSAGLDGSVYVRLLARGVTLTNAAGVNGGVIAQHVLALMLAHARRLHAYRAFQARAEWHRLECDELAGATALLIGLGGIGGAVARLCRAFEMRVLGVRRRPEPVPHVDVLLPPEQLRHALAEADYVVVACPLTPSTRGLIDARALAALKPTAYLVNVARGPIVDTTALYEALCAGRIAGAALDVFDREPLPPDSPLWTAPNLTITPHTATSSPLNPVRNARFFLDNLARFVRGESLRNVVERLD